MGPILGLKNSNVGNYSTLKSLKHSFSVVRNLLSFSFFFYLLFLVALLLLLFFKLGQLEHTSEEQDSWLKQPPLIGVRQAFPFINTQLRQPV